MELSKRKIGNYDITLPEVKIPAFTEVYLLDTYIDNRAVSGVMVKVIVEIEEKVYLLDICSSSIQPKRD